MRDACSFSVILDGPRIYGGSFSVILDGPRICGVNHFLQ